MLNGEEFDFSTLIYSNTTLVAKWEDANAHKHEYISTVVDPTCTQSGYIDHVCNCGDFYQDNIIAPLNHDFIYHSGKDATCTEIGWEEYVTCSRCDYTNYKELEALNHDIVYHTKKEAT